MKLWDFRGASPLSLATDLGPLTTGDNVGIEIELEGLKIIDKNSGEHKYRPPLGWMLHEDRSLRNNGVEFVFSGPAGGKEVWKRLTDLEVWFKENKLKPVASNRTSVHVHIDASDTTCSEMLKWALIYTIYEPLLFAEFASDRETSNFCVPVYNSTDIRLVLGKLRGNELGYATTNWREFYDGIVLQRETKRYAAMNLDAIRKFSTLEFRHLGGEYRSTPILEWVNTLLSLKKWAMDPNTSVKDIFHGPSRMYSDQMTYRIFEPRTASRFLFNRKFKELYFKGIRTAQEIYLQPDIPKVPPVLKDVIEVKKKERLKTIKTKLAKFIDGCPAAPDGLESDLEAYNPFDSSDDPNGDDGEHEEFNEESDLDDFSEEISLPTIDIRENPPMPRPRAARDRSLTEATRILRTAARQNSFTSNFDSNMFRRILEGDEVQATPPTPAEVTPVVTTGTQNTLIGDWPFHSIASRRR